MNKKKTWMYIAIGAIILSVVSLFLPVITYQNSNGNVYSFNILGVITKGSDFIDYILMDNDGSFVERINSPALVSLLSMSSDDALPKVLIALVAIIGITAIVASFLGIRSMSKQYAGEIVKKVWKAARQAGYGSYFPKSEGGMITDDHIPVNCGNNNCNQSS